MDERKQFFYQSDILRFQTDEYQLDDAIRFGQCDVIDRYSNRLRQRIEAFMTYIATLEDAVLDYSRKDTLYFRSEQDFDYFKDHLSFKRYWNKRIRYFILDYLVEKDSTLFKDQFPRPRSRGQAQNHSKSNVPLR